jgi:hypothetical protein
MIIPIHNSNNNNNLWIGLIYLKYKTSWHSCTFLIAYFRAVKKEWRKHVLVSRYSKEEMLLQRSISNALYSLIYIR